MKRKPFILLPLVVVLAACSSAIEPRRVEGVVVLPPQWHAAAEEPETEQPLPAWGELFDDGRLDALIAEAIEANRVLDAAAARVERAAAQARIAGADLYPQLSGTLDAGRRRQNFIGLPIPGAEDRVLTNTSTTFGTGLNVSWEADLWGRLRSARAAARADAESVRADFSAAQLSIAGQVAKTWFSVLEAAEQVELAVATVENRALTAERIRRRYEAGLSPSVDLRLAESNSALAASRLQQRNRQLDAASRQLEILLGRYPAAAIEPGDRLPDLLAPIPPGIPASVLARRPDLRVAERRVAAASARVAQARASLYPQLRLTGSGGTTSTELEDLLDGDFSVWSLGAGLLQPLFQGGRLRANVDLARAVEDEALAGFAQSVLSALAEVETALFAQDVLARQEEALALAAMNAVEAQRTAEQRYAAGLSDFLLLLETQRQAFEAESQLLDLRRQRLSSRVDLYLALGGDAAAPFESPDGAIDLTSDRNAP
jgi:outer membrane protein, multidrug efflux system